MWKWRFGDLINGEAAASLLVEPNLLLTDLTKHQVY
jgi:hypothetical protein